MAPFSREFPIIAIGLSQIFPRPSSLCSPSHCGSIPGVAFESSCSFYVSFSPLTLPTPKSMLTVVSSSSKTGMATKGSRNEVRLLFFHAHARQSVCGHLGMQSIARTHRQDGSRPWHVSTLRLAYMAPPQSFLQFSKARGIQVCFLSCRFLLMSFSSECDFSSCPT